MPQEAQGNVSYSQNPTGVGAVYFDKVADPLSIHLDNLKMLDEGARHRANQQIEKAKIAQDMMKDINPDVAGIMDTDEEHFKQKSSELVGTYAEALSKGIDPTSQAGRMAYAQSLKNAKQLEFEALASKAQKDAWVKAATEY